MGVLAFAMACLLLLATACIQRHKAGDYVREEELGSASSRVEKLQ